MSSVVDASALGYALLAKSSEASALRRRLGSDECHAPHLIDAELGNLLRRRVLRHHLDPDDAEALLAAGGAFVDHRYEMTGRLARGAWSHHQNLTFYDALYVTLATALGVPLVTADARLAGAPALGCTVERIGP